MLFFFTVFLRSWFQLRFPPTPHHLTIRDIPCLTFIIITLEEQEGSAIICRKDMGMSGFAAVPFTFLAIRQERDIAHTGPADAILTHGQAHLLRPIVISASIEHIQLAATTDNRGPLYTFALPRELGI